MGQVENSEGVTSDLLSTPQKNQNKKKLKGGDGVAAPCLANETNDAGSAALLESDRRAQ